MLKMIKAMLLKLTSAMEELLQNEPVKKQCVSRSLIQNAERALEPDITAILRDLDGKQDTGPAELGNLVF